MKKLLLLSLIAGIAITGCKKNSEEKLASPVVTQSLASVYTPKMNKTWTCDGYHIYSSHPSSQNPAHTYTDTTIYHNHEFKFNVVNDTTIIIGKDSLSYFGIDNTGQFIEFIPPSYIRAKFRPTGTSLKYYYTQDSIRYYYHDYGVSFDRITYLYGK